MRQKSKLSELEERLVLVEITAAEQNKEKKNEKKWEQFKRPLRH